MHLTYTLNPFKDTDLLFAQQMGVDWIIADVPAWDADTLAAAANRVMQAGLQLCSLSSLPADLATRASEGDAGAVTRIRQIISDAGRLGIPAVSYRWPGLDCAGAVEPSGGRGASVSAVYGVENCEWADSQDKRKAMWSALTALLRKLVPDAESAGVRLVHQTDIALASLPTAERILDNVTELDQLSGVVGSPCHGLNLDYGFVTQVLAPSAGVEPEDVLRQLGKSGGLFALQMRSLCHADRGAREVFLDEDRVAVLRALRVCRSIGFGGALLAVASPEMADDTVWRHKGHAFNTGYLRAMLQAIGC